MDNRQRQQACEVAVLVEPEEEQHRQLEQELPSWRLVELPAGQVTEDASTVDSADVVLVFAKAHEEDHALEVSKQVRGDHRFDDVPLLVAISIYQMPLGHDIRKLPKADFIFSPIAPDDFDERLSTLKTQSEPIA